MTSETIHISQSVAILIDGNNIERSLHTLVGRTNVMLNFDTVIPRVLKNRGLNRLIYFREGENISNKLAERLHANYHGSVFPCGKSADIPLTIKATQIAHKVDAIIIFSGDKDYLELVRHLKSEGVRVEIAAVENNTAAILKDEIDHFFPITKDDCFEFTAPSHKPSHHGEQGRRNKQSPAKRPAASMPQRPGNHRGHQAGEKPAQQ